jgi:hypothetical protein
MHGKSAKASAAARLALALCGGGAACGTASSPVVPGPAPSPHKPTSPPAQNTSRVTVTGSADTSSAAPVAGVTVAFKLAADLGSCGTCGLHTLQGHRASPPFPHGQLPARRHKCGIPPTRHQATAAIASTRQQAIGTTPTSVPAPGRGRGEPHGGAR